MADGFDRNTNRGKGLIAFTHEEHGLGAKAAQNYSNSTARSTPRSTPADTFTSLISKHVDTAIVPIENDIGGYNTNTLLSLIDFKGYQIKKDVSSQDRYVLAVPYAQVMELSESSFSSSFSKNLTVGNLPRDMQTQEALRRRISSVFVSSDAQSRCGPALDGLRAEGMDIKPIPNGADPYRFGVKTGFDSLDRDRIIETHHSDATGDNMRVSKMRGSNYTKSLNAVLLPFDQATLGMRSLNAEETSKHVSFGESDYIIIEDRLEGEQDINTRFLAVGRAKPNQISLGRKIAYTLFGWTPYWRPEVAEYTKRSGPLHKAFNDRKGDEKNIRVLIKASSAGRNVTDISALSREIAKQGLNYSIVPIADRPDVPTVFEVELKSRKQIDYLGDVLEFAFRDHHGWKAKVLGMYPTSSAMIGNKPAKVHNPFIRPIYITIATGAIIYAVVEYVRFKMNGG